MNSNARRSIAVTVMGLSIASSLVGCSALKEKLLGAKADASSEVDAAAAIVDAAVLGAKNEASVLRFAQETSLGYDLAVIGDTGATARTAPGSGPEVGKLSKGTPVLKIAQYSGDGEANAGVLVMFDDPSNDGSKLLGWVPTKVFDAAAPRPSKPIVPPAFKDAGAAVQDAGAAVQDAGAGSHDAGAASRDAGAASSDAGGAAPRDAGAAASDAGGGSGGLAQPPKGAIAVPPVNGKCPDGWTLTDSMCRRKCSSDATCPRGTKCTTKGSDKVCSSG